MTVLDVPIVSAPEADDGVQHFLFDGVDWGFYTHLSKMLDERRVFATYYKGSLEIVTVSMLHDRIVGLLTLLVRILAEETDTPLIGAGMTTLKRVDLKEAVEPDSSFYIAHVSRMRRKTRLNLKTDPPPDLAIEVEVTRRLAARKQIYRDIGVPEIWVYRDGKLTILKRMGNRYEPVERSLAFPQFIPSELGESVVEALTDDETMWAKSVRRKVREIVVAGRRKS